MNIDERSLNTTATKHARIQAVGFDYASRPHRSVPCCNLCGSDQFTIIAHRDRYGFPVNTNGCQGCSLVFLNPVMTSDAYGAFYGAMYRPLVSAYHGRLIDARTIQAEQRDYAKERAALLSPFLPTRHSTTLLDIGGSTGVVAHAFAKRFGISGTVVDPAPLETDEAKQLGLETVTGFIEEVDLGDRKFDVILMCQAIDHLLDIRAVLNTVRGLIASDGVFFVDIVDFRAVYLKHWSVEEAVKVDHPFYLTELTMSTFLARAGFEVVRIEYATDDVHIGYVCRASSAEPDKLPPDDAIAKFWQELRHVQSAPRRR